MTKVPHHELSAMDTTREIEDTSMNKRLDIIDHVRKKVSGISLNLSPFPHVFIENIFTESFRQKMRSSFQTEEFHCYFEGAVPVHHITQSSSGFLRFFKEEILSNCLVPQFNEFFSEYESEKVSTLIRDGHQFNALEEPVFESIYLALNRKGGSIRPHLDSYWASYQFVFYVGDAEDRPSPTTDLIDARAARYVNEKVIDGQFVSNYGSSKNGLIAFINSDHSYHGLSEPLLHDRFTVCVSVHRYIKTSSS